MVHLLVAVAAVVATPLPTAPLPEAVSPAQPALFVVRDEDTTIYIFGTFHALDSRTNWFASTIRDALDRSDELVLETVLPEKPSELPRAALAFKSLSLTPSASFLATTRMAIDAGREQGMQVDNGADNILRHVAEEEGKRVDGLETLQLQVNMFNHIPPSVTTPEDPATGAINSSAEVIGLSKAMAEMQSAWKKGDQTVFVRMLSNLKAASPETYRMMFTERNTRWADWVRARMQTPGTVFVAVGAGHLAGPDSLLVRLAERGYYSKRVN